MWNDSLWGYDILPVEVALKPWFYDTKTDLPDSQDGICLGEDVILYGDIKNHTWKEERTFLRNETFPYYLTNESNYSSYITRRSFDIGKTLNSALSIDSIGVNLEHSNTSSIRIKISCPTGDTVMLKDTGGVEKYFGEPVVEPNNFSEGIGYWYYFSNFPEYGKMNEYNGGDTLPSGTYQSDSLLSKLEGCSLNGDWTISIEDFDDDNDDGYVFAWALYFKDEYEDDTIEYFNKYYLQNSYWTGSGINISNNGQGEGEAKPTEYGNLNYKYTIKDNFSCLHDTIIEVFVEKAHFEADTTEMYIGDSVKVEDKTSWAIQWEWDFGDESDILTNQSEYKKYADSGHYEIVLTAYSESGCQDYDTVNMKIVPKNPIEIADYNVFTPNGDGVNDVFSFFNTNDEKIDAANIQEINCKIFNRFGEVVCKWKDPQEAVKGWDGTKNNDGIRNLPSGFYFYTIIMTGKYEQDYEPKKGFIYLYREK